METNESTTQGLQTVSMESGLEDRNNLPRLLWSKETRGHVSMESGLEDRNNAAW